MDFCPSDIRVTKPYLKCQLFFLGTYIKNSTDTIKARHSEGFNPKNLFCLDTSLTLSMTLF